MRYRYVGPDEARFLAVSGGGIEFPQGEWVDPVEVAQVTGIDPLHLEIVLAGLGPDWEAEGAKRRKSEPETPAVPDEETP